jgi:hypothetical protein
MGWESIKRMAKIYLLQKLKDSFIRFTVRNRKPLEQVEFHNR